MKPGKAVVERLLAASPAEASAILAELEPALLRRLAQDWPAWVHGGQEVPAHGDWRVCVMLGGRGFGKTRAGAEWISAQARAHPGARFALVAATLDEARRVMIEGKSGLIAVARAGEAPSMRWEPSRRRLVFASGAEAFLYSGASADSLRGPEHHFAWCDELAKWAQAADAWANLLLGLRLGSAPRALITTTPRAGPLLSALLEDAATSRKGGPSEANVQLPPDFVADMRRRLGGSRAAREELDGELIEEAQGALWTRALIEACRDGEMGTVTGNCPPRPLRRIVIGVDPPASAEGDACGIVACGVDRDGIGYVLGDHSERGLSPEGWAAKVVAAAESWGADCVIVEANQGGDMVKSVLRAADPALPVRPVHARFGKGDRAEPVAILFETGRARFAGSFPALEDELCAMVRGGFYAGPGRSPDRADAMVWAMTELMLGRERGPRLAVL